MWPFSNRRSAAKKFTQKSWKKRKTAAKELFAAAPADDVDKEATDEPLEPLFGAGGKFQSSESSTHLQFLCSGCWLLRRVALTGKEAVPEVEVAGTQRRLRLVAVAGVQFPEALTAIAEWCNKVAYSFLTQKSSSRREGVDESKFG